MRDDVLSDAGVNFIQECRDDLEHDPHCAVFNDNRGVPRECDCELALWDDLLSSHRALEFDLATSSAARERSIKNLQAIEEWLDEWSESVSEMALGEFPGFEVFAHTEEETR